MGVNLQPGIVEISVLDWNLMKRFYVETMGLAAISIEDDHGYAWLCGSPITVSLKRVAGSNQRERPSNISLQFVVDDIHEAVSQLEAKGCAFLRKEMDPDAHYSAAYFSDPEGNALAIYQLR